MSEMRKAFDIGSRYSQSFSRDTYPIMKPTDVPQYDVIRRLSLGCNQYFSDVALTHKS